MPAGLPYFAWVDASETVFGPEHLRWDEAVFSFTLAQEEGDPATLTAVVRRPRNEAGDPIGLLGPGRKIWVWFALDCGPGLVKFRGRLVGIPTSLFEELVTLEFVAKPSDFVAQKEALADTLKVLPFYDEAVIEPARRDDPDVVLEGYTKIWHFDRETHVMTVSDEISGEDGLVSFDGVSETGKVLYDGLGLALTSGPLARVEVKAEFNWTQQAYGTVDLTGYLSAHWPDAGHGEFPSLNASDWPKHGTSLGDGWEVAEASAVDLYDYTTSTNTVTTQALQSWDLDGATAQANTSRTTGFVANAGPMVSMGAVVTNDSYNLQHSVDSDGISYQASLSRSYSEAFAAIGIQYVAATLVAGYKANRQCTERVSLTLVADVQPILTDPEDGEALRIDDIRSVNLTEENIIGDARRRSYIATERGNQSIEHLIVLARAHLMKRARVVEITFAPKLERMPEVTLRKNAFLVEPRVGEAHGKIIGYSIALDGSDGRMKCEVRMGCTIGNGGTVAAAAGDPTYCTIDYTGADYQVFINRTVLVDIDSSVGYQPPAADPNDDGIDFLSSLSAEDVIEVPLVVLHGATPESGSAPTNEGNATAANALTSQRLLEARRLYMRLALEEFETTAKFKLKSMNREFSTDYEIQVTELKIPTGYDLEAA